MALPYPMTSIDAADAFNNPGMETSQLAGAVAWREGNGRIIDDPFGINRVSALEVLHFEGIWGVGQVDSDSIYTPKPSGVQNNFYWIGGSKSEIYLAMDMGFPNSYVFPEGIHLAQIASNKRADDTYIRCRFQLSGMGLLGVPYGAIGLYFGDQIHGTGDYPRCWYFNPNDPANPSWGSNGNPEDYLVMSRGKWHRLEMRLKLNTTGFTIGDSTGANGIMQAWYDQKLVLDLQNRQWINSYDLTQKWDYGQFTTWHGGTGDEWASPIDQSIYFDNVIVSPFPITHTEGSIVIQGESNFDILDRVLSGANGDAIRLTGCSNVNILRCQIRDGINGIFLQNCTNITIEDNYIFNCTGRGVYVNISSGVGIEHNHIHDCYEDAVYSYDSDNVTVDWNLIEDCESGYIGYLDNNIGNLSCDHNFIRRVHRRQEHGFKGNGVGFFLINKGYCHADDNIILNEDPTTEADGITPINPSDVMSFYICNGTVSVPFTFKRNKVRGATAALQSAGGILLGDKGGSYQISEDNFVMNTCGYMVAIAGGDHCTLNINQAFRSEEYADSVDWANVGMYLMSIKSTDPCTDHTITGNVITSYKTGDYNGTGNPAGEMQPWYTDNLCDTNLTMPVGSNTLDYDELSPTLSESDWLEAWNTPPAGTGPR